MTKVSTEWTVLSMLEWATDYFEKKEIRNPRLSIEWLLADVLDVKRLDLYLMHDRPLTNLDLEKLKPSIKRRAKHEPLQYILGSTEFFGLSFLVDSNVLIPRPETEQLVEIILNDYQDQQDFNVIDVGTGSGCIPITLKSKRPNWNVVGVDISESALNLAKQNAKLNNVEVDFINSDLFQIDQFSNLGKFDLLISNPPYIEENEKPTLDKEVIAFEPGDALFCSSTLEMYSALRSLSTEIVKPNGSIFLELNERFGNEVRDTFQTELWAPKLVKDYDSKDRFLVAQKQPKKNEF